MSEQRSIEQVCRDILEQAVKDGIVTFRRESFGSTTDVQSLTSGDICGVANVLRDYLAETRMESFTTFTTTKP